MVFSLIICTYKRPQPLLRLLESVVVQTLYPAEILIIDGSPDNSTEALFVAHSFPNLIYYQVTPEQRGLTKQRNFGIGHVQEASEVICFLDDDTVLEPCYFEEIIRTYTIRPKALAVGGYITNEVSWEFVGNDYTAKLNEFCYDGWKRADGLRFVVRKKFGLDSNVPPGFAPEFSHGRSIGFLPPSGKIYESQQLMGGVSSFRKSVFETLQFSNYFEGYGLYEDADFTLRVSSLGLLYVNTNAKLAHYHDVAGRPNQYLYGKMVVRNGYYVWRVKYPNPSVKAKFKWHAITLLLIAIRFSNVMDASSAKRKTALEETIGRFIGWCSLIFDSPLSKSTKV